MTLTYSNNIKRTGIRLVRTIYNFDYNFIVLFVITCLAEIYPAFCIPDNWNARYPRVEDIPEVSEIWGVKLGKKFMMDIRQMKPYEVIGKYKGNVLIVHGSDDKVVALDYSKRAEQTYDHATLKVIAKAGHGFNPRERALSNQYVKEFLSK